MASAKTLSLLLRAERGGWSILEQPAARLAFFLSRVARNGMVDASRAAKRRAQAHRRERESLPTPEGALPIRANRSAMVELALESAIAGLPRRTRAIWLSRVLRGMSSRDIAAATGLKVSNVDVIMSRARERIRQSLEAYGAAARDISGAVFWRISQRFGSEVVPGDFSK
ncbi:MAG: RNA polymerase sigma factor [Candidatus Eisenbacteria bacterium]